MAQRIYFRRSSEDQLIHLPVFWEFGGIRSGGFFVLDTGASHTVVDLNSLYLMGYRRNNNVSSVHVMTAGGVVEGQLITLDRLECLGKTINAFTVVGYDFLALGSTDDAEGMIGLDFLNQTRLQLDFIENYVEMEQTFNIR